MKTYLITTGALFALIALAHIARIFAEWPRPMTDHGFVLEMAVTTLLPALLSFWAWRLLRKLSKSRA